MEVNPRKDCKPTCKQECILVTLVQTFYILKRVPRRVFAKLLRHFVDLKAAGSLPSVKDISVGETDTEPEEPTCYFNSTYYIGAMVGAIPTSLADFPACAEFDSAHIYKSADVEAIVPAALQFLCLCACERIAKVFDHTPLPQFASRSPVLSHK